MSNRSSRTPEEARLYAREYRSKNKEAAARTVREYKKRNKQKIKDYNARYYKDKKLRKQKEEEWLNMILG